MGGEGKSEQKRVKNSVKGGTKDEKRKRRGKKEWEG